MSTSNFIKSECRQCAGHLAFPAEAAGQTITCPHCGQPTELVAPVPAAEPSDPRRIWPGVIAGVLLGLLGLSAAIFFFNKPKPEHAIVSTVQPAQPKQTNVIEPTTPPPVHVLAPVGESMNGFTYSDIKLEKMPGSSLVYATGKIINSSDHRRFGVKVELNLFDARTNSVGKTKDYQPMLEPGAEWHFKAMIMESKAASARLTTILEDK